MRSSTNAASETKEVQVLQYGSDNESFDVDVEATVEDVLNEAGIDTDRTVKCDGEVVALTDIPDNGDRLCIADKVKGGRA